MTRRRASQTLVLDDGQVCCSACGHGLVPIGQSWKPRARLSSVAVASMPGAGLGIDQRLELRLFTCPACAALLDSETALPEDPFLEDIIYA
jgi:acetone carboxylase gamma subunit